MRGTAYRRAWPAAVLVLLAACTTDPGTADPDRPADPTPSASVADPTPDPDLEPTPEPEAPAPERGDRLPPVASPVSLPALMREEPTPTRIVRTRLQLTTDAYRRYEVTYRSGEVTVSGILLVPDGKGPFPGIVLNHGYIEPSVYVTGQGLSREQDWLARAGFAVLHTDYRGHAASDPATGLSRETRLGYTRDAINAVRALRREPYVDRGRMAMLGRSMGGGVTYNALVARPGLVDAAVVFAPVSSRYLDNLRRWTLPERPEAADALFERFGSPQENPRFYRDLSARTYFDRVTEPLLIHHGTLDDSCPIAWSRTTQALLREAGVSSRLEVYEGEQHAFGPQWPESMVRTVAFLRRHLGR